MKFPMIMKKDIQQKAAKFVQILGILNNLNQIWSRNFQEKVFNALALQILIYGNEIWTLRKKDKNY